jgi:pimeloyl-ACP methyl ester carboxylesterase
LHRFDPAEVSASIRVPVLLIAGEQDISLDPGIEEAAQLIPKCTMHVYWGSNHFGAITSPRLAANTQEFIDQQQAPAGPCGGPPDPPRRGDAARATSAADSAGP